MNAAQGSMSRLHARWESLAFGLLRRLCAVLLIGAVAGGTGCEGAPGIDVTVIDLPPQVRSLKVRTTLIDTTGLLHSGAPRNSQRSGCATDSLQSQPNPDGWIDQNLSKFKIALPPGVLVGHVKLEIEALDGLRGGCLVATGSIADVQFDAVQRSPAEVTMRPVPDGCSLTVQMQGIGEAEVISVPPGIDCGGPGKICKHTFPLLPQVELKLNYVSSSLQSWDGGAGCSGIEACNVQIGAAGKTVKLNLARPRVCNADNWCSDYPLPFSGNISAVWAASAAEVWAVGQNGVVWQYPARTPQPTKNNGWEFVPSGTKEHLNALWGSGATDIWAVGDKGTILHWNGLVWSAWGNPDEKKRSLRGIWGSAADHVWAVGDEGAILKWDGTDWSAMDFPDKHGASLFGIWGSDAEHVWAVGWAAGRDDEPGVQIILRWNGSQWTEDYSAPAEKLFAYRIWGSGPTDIWAVGGFYSDGASAVSNVILHSDGSGWMPSPDAPHVKTSFDGICGSGPGDIWMVGGDLAILNPENGESPESQAILHRVNNKWLSESSNTSEPLVNCWAVSEKNAWAVSNKGTLLHRDGKTKTWSGDLTPPPNPTEPNDSVWINGIWGSLPTDVWAVGVKTSPKLVTAIILHWDGTDGPEGIGWTSYPNPPNFQGGLNSIWGSSDKDIWAASDVGSVLHWDGQAWSWFSTKTRLSLRAIWGSAKSAGSSSPSGLQSSELRPRSSGNPWQQLRNPNPDPGGSYDPREPPSSPGPGPSPDPPRGPVDPCAAKDVWAVGSKGTIQHWNGSDWTSMSIKDQPQLNGIWGSGSEDIWVVGQGGIILHWDNVTWSQFASGIKEDLRAVWGSSAKDVWAVGGNKDPIILRWDGTKKDLPKQLGAQGCRKQKDPFLRNPYLSGIWGSDPEDVRAIDFSNGNIWHLVGQDCKVERSGASQLNSIWGFGPQDVLVGGPSSIFRHRP